MKIVECVPNASEGCRANVISRLADAVRSDAGVRLLDIHSDADHNRSVFTFAGGPDEIREAAFLFAEAAVKYIDLNKHTGGHPRIGAADVIPFVPIKDATMDECVTVARDVGERIANELGVPVFLYESAAAKPERKNLAEIRRGGFENLNAKLSDPFWVPDYGPARAHPTAGAFAVGARKPLVAFNVLLDTHDVKVAKKIANAVRESNGGLPNVKALGIFLREKNAAQVSMNLTDCDATPIFAAFECVKEEAAKLGAKVVSSELVGLAPYKFLKESEGLVMLPDDVTPESHSIEGRMEGIIF